MVTRLEQLQAELGRREIQASAPEPQTRLEALKAEQSRRSVREEELGGTAGIAETGLREFTQGATLGFADEIAAGATAGVLSLGGILGLTPEELQKKSVGELFSEAKSGIRGREKELREENPVTAIIGNITGGIATGGAGVAKAAALKGLKGAAATVGTAGALGTAAGAGFSEEQEAGKIIQDALEGGAISAATAGVLSGAARAGAPLVKKTINSLVRSKSPNKFTQAEEFVKSKITDGTAPELLNDINKAQAAGISSPLAAVTQDQSLKTTASLLAQDVQTSNLAQKSIKKISDTITKAERNVLNTVGKDVKTAQEGADVFKQSLTSLKNGAIEARRIAAEPLYTKSVQAGNRLRIPVVSGLKNFKRPDGTTNPMIGQTMDDLRKTGMFGGLPDNSMPVLDATFKKLGAQARAADDSFQKALILEAQKKLRVEMSKKFPTYDKAVKTFSDESDVLNQLTRDKKNPLGILLAADDVDSVVAVGKIFNQQPELIARTRAFAVANNLEDSFEAGAKSNILEKIERSVRADGSAAAVFKAPKARKQLAASLGGREKADAFQKVMEVRDDFTQFNRITQGSQTEPLKIAGQELAQAGQTTTGKILGGSVKKFGQLKDFVFRTDKTIEDISEALQTPQFRQEVANILFDRKRGKVFLQKINSANAQESRATIGKLFSTAIDKVRAAEPQIQQAITGQSIATGEFLPLNSVNGRER